MKTAWTGEVFWDRWVWQPGAAALALPKTINASSNLNYNLTSPNSLLIIVDQLRYKELSGYAYDVPFPGLSSALPNTTKLQSQSVEFTNCFVAGTSCTPSRASMVTGLYPTQTAMYETQGNAAMPNLTPTYRMSNQQIAGYIGYPTFGSYISAPSPSPNYNCLWFGKWHLADESPDLITNMQAYGFQYGSMPSPNGTSPNQGVNRGLGKDKHAAVSANYRSDQDIVTQFADTFPSAWMNERPWLTVVSLINPHDEASPWPPNITGDNLATKPYLQAAYQASMQAVNGSVSDVPGGGTNNSNNGDWGAF